jgi:glycerophosphoryl diester phosphodiesterase
MGIREIRSAGSGQVVVVGHRGAMGHAPENTMGSFRRAMSLGADGVELDVRLSADGEAMVIHDAAVDRTTDGNGLVSSMTTGELRELDAGSGDRIPRLAEVLEWAVEESVELTIEIKGDPAPLPGLVSRVIDLLDHYGRASEVMLISFHHPTVRQIKDYRPDIVTGILYGGYLADTVAAARAALADSVRPSWHFWTPELVGEVHRAGLSASAWTVNEEAAIQSVASMGVDSLATNYPDRARLVLGSRRG